VEGGKGRREGLIGLNREKRDGRRRLEREEEGRRGRSGLKERTEEREELTINGTLFGNVFRSILLENIYASERTR
jgi:hypothetical protein